MFLGVARGAVNDFVIRSVNYGVASEPFTIGGTDSGEPFRGHIGEVLVFDRILTVAESDSIEAYLEAKWGVQ